MPTQSADPGKATNRVPGEGKLPSWQWRHPSGLTTNRGGLTPSGRIRVRAIALTALAPRRVQRGAAAALSWAFSKP